MLIIAEGGFDVPTAVGARIATFNFWNVPCSMLRAGRGTSGTAAQNFFFMVRVGFLIPLVRTKTGGGTKNVHIQKRV